jgi:TP901 family phage tail tape measure protein
MTDFDILIGVDMSQAEDDIKKSLKTIGETYPIKLKAVLENENEIKESVEGLAKLVSKLKLIDVNLGLGDDIKQLKDIQELIQKISKQDLNVGDGLADSIEDANKQIKDLQNNLKSVESVFNRLMKLQSKTYYNNGNVEQIVKKEKTGNKFINQTVTGEALSGELISVESVKDVKAFTEYLNKTNEKLEKMKRVSSLLPQDFQELIDRVKQLETLFNDNSPKFDAEFKEVERLLGAYDKLEKKLAERNKLLDQAEKKFQKANLSFVPEHQVKQLEEIINEYRTKANQVKGGAIPTVLTDDGNIEQMVQDIIDKTNQLIQLNNTLKERQKEFVKYQKEINKNVEKWVQNGHLAKEEVDEFVSLFKSLDIYSENFYKDLEKVQNKFKELSQREQKIISDKKEQEKALALIEQNRLELEKKYHDIQQRGYANYQSMAKLGRLINELDIDRLKTLEAVRNKLKEINQQLAKINKQESDKKFNKKRLEQVERLNKDINDNLNVDILGEKNIDQLRQKVSSIFEADTIEKVENRIKSARKEYERLLAQQKERIQQLKDEKQLQEYLQQMEARRANEENEQKAREFLVQENINKVQNKIDEFSNRKAFMIEKGMVDDGQFDEIENRLAKLREKARFSFIDNINIDKELAQVDKLIVRIEKEFQNLLKVQKDIETNQEIINESVQEWEKEIQELKNKGFINEDDLTKVRNLMDNLNAESKDLRRQLSEVRKELNAVARLSNQRESRSEDIQIIKNKNEEKLNGLLERNIIPIKEMIDEVKQLNDSLDFSSSKTDIEEVNINIKKLLQLEQDIIKAGKEENKIRKLIADTQQELTKVTDKYIGKLNDLKKKLQDSVKDENKILQIEQDIAQAIDNVNDYKQRGIQLSYEEVRTLNQQIKAIEDSIRKQKELEAIQDRRERKIQQLNDRFDSVSYRAKRGFDKNPLEREELTKMEEQIKQDLKNLANVPADQFEQKVKDIEKAMTGLSRRSSELRDKITEHNNSLIGQFENAMMKVPIWISAMTIFYGTLHQVSQGIQYLLEFDKAMTNLKKVTEATNEELEEFRNQSTSMAKDLGVLASDVVNATAEFQKLGYTLQESAILGKNTILYANVGDMDLQKAQENIVSTVKGFNIEIDKTGQNVRKVVDMFNEVSNNYAISAEGIGEALKRSSAVLKESGNTIEQAVGLVTAANTTIQDPEKVGTALKTISMRLKGVDEEGKKVVTLVPELEKTFSRISDKLGLVGEERLSLMKDKNTFKSTFEIFDQLAKVWNRLDDIERANLVELIGGKEQGAIVAAMINNWSDAVGAYETALHSAGSAQREFNNYMDSFEYKIGRLKGAMQEFWLTLLNDEGIKAMIDGLTKIVELMTALTKFVGGNTIIMEFFGFLLIFGNKTLRDAVLGLTSMTEVFKRLGMVVGSFVRFIPKLLAIGTVIFVITKAGELIYKLINAEEIAREKRMKGLEDEIKKAEELKQTWEEIDGERYIELSRKENRTPEEEREYLMLQEKIKENMPDMIAYYDEQGRAVLKTADAMQALIEKQEKAALNKREELLKLEVEEVDFDELEYAVNKAKTQLDKIQDSQKEIKFYNFTKDWINENLKTVEQGTGEYKKKVEQLISILEDRWKESGMDIFTFTDFKEQLRHELLDPDMNDATKFLDNLINNVKGKTDNLKHELDKSKKDITLNIEDFSAKLSEAIDIAVQQEGYSIDSNEYLFAKTLQKAIEENLEQFETKDVKNIVKKIPKILNTAFKELESNNINLDKIMNVNEPDTKYLEEAIKKVTKNMKLEKDEAKALVLALESLKQQHMETANVINNNKIDGFSGFKNEVLPLVDQYIKNITDLESAYRTLADGEKLSLSQIYELISQYPELTKHLKVHDGQLQISASAIRNLMKIKEKEFKNDLKMKKEQAIAEQKKVESSIRSMLKEANATELLTKIKQKSTQQIIEEYQKQLLAAQGFETYWKQLESGGYVPDEIVSEMFKIKNKAQQELGALLSDYVDFQNEIDAINKLLETDWTIDVGSTDKENMEQYAYITDKFKLALEEVNARLEHFEKLQRRLADYSKDYRNAILEEIKVLKEKKRLLDEQAKSLEKQIRSGKILETGIVEIKPTTSTTSTKVSGNSKEAIIWNFFKSKGFSDSVVAGILGNLKHESGLSTTIVNPTSGATGLAQWLGSRLRQLKSYARSLGESWTDLNVQLQFMWKELNSTERKTLNWLLSNQNADPTTVAIMFEKLYERAGGAGLRQRVSYANAYYRKFAGTVNTTTATTKNLSRETAEAQQAIDEAKLEVFDLKEQSEAVQEQIQELYFEIVKSGSRYYEFLKKTYEDDIAHAEYMMNVYAQSDKQYRTYANHKIRFLGKQLSLEQRHLAYLEKELKTNKNLTPQQRTELYEMIIEQRQAVDEAKQALSEMYFELIKSNEAYYDNLKKTYEDDIAHAEYMMGFYDESARRYRKFATDKIRFLRQQLTYEKQYLAYLEKELRTNKKLTPAQRNELYHMIIEQRKVVYEATKGLSEMYFELIRSNEEHFNGLRDSYEDDIAYVDYIMNLYDEASVGYRNYANIKLKYLQKQLLLEKQHLAYLEKEKKENKNLTHEQRAELEDMIREQRKTVYNMSKNAIDLQTAIYKSSFEQTFKRWEDEMKLYEKRIDDIQDKLRFDIEKDNNPLYYRDEIASLQQILSLQKGRKQDIESYIKMLEKEKQKYKDNKDMIEMINQAIEKWSNELESVDDSIKETSNSIKDVYKTLADEFVEIYKEQLRLMQEAEEKAYEEKMRNEEKAHEQRMDNLDKELERIRKAYELQLKMIDRNEEEHDFRRERSRLQEEISEIQKKINVLMLDGSYEAEAKRLELEKELREKQMELAEMEHDREIELRKQNLEDDLQSKEEQIENSKKQADEEYETLVEQLDKEREERQKYWEDVLNDERKFRAMRLQIMNGEFEDALNSLKEWKNNIEKETEHLGLKIKENFVDRIVEAINALTALKNANIGSFDRTINVGEKNLNLPSKQEPESELPKNREQNLSTHIPTSSGGVGSSYHMTNPPAKKPLGYVEVVTNTWLYKTPSEQTSARIRMLKKGERYRYYGIEGNFYNLGGTYANKKHLKIVGSGSSSSSSSSSGSKTSSKPTTPPKTTTTSSKPATTSSSSKTSSPRWRTITALNLRSLPSYDGKVIAVMPKGVVIEFLGMEKGWAKIRYNGKVGYAGRQYIEQFDTGGYTGEWGREGKLAILHEKELVLNQDQTKDILTTAEIMERIKNFIPKLNVATMKLSPIGTGETSETVVNNYEYKLNVNIENMNGDKRSADIVADQIMQKIKRTRGGRF